MHDDHPAAVLERLVTSDDPPDGGGVDVVGLLHVEEHFGGEPGCAQERFKRILPPGFKIPRRDIPFRGDTNGAVLLDRQERKLHGGVV